MKVVFSEVGVALDDGFEVINEVDHVVTAAYYSFEIRFDSDRVAEVVRDGGASGVWGAIVVVCLGFFGGARVLFRFLRRFPLSRYCGGGIRRRREVL
jgi:hypothetical protein